VELNPRPQPAFVGSNCIRTNPIIIIPATAIIRKNAAFVVIKIAIFFNPKD
jgi:hypothetical protein